MLADFKRINDSRIKEDVIIGSADVKALYLSLDIPFTVEKVCEVFHASSVQIIGLNAEELGLYLALNRTEAELRDVGLLQFCPRGKTSRGRPPTITGCALDESKVKRFKPWLLPSEEPDEDTIRKMFTEALKIALSFVMNHIYTFDNQIKLQSKGGPIGLELTGVIAQLFMVWWDRQFKIEMSENGLKLRLYKRYVDDVNVIINAPKAGFKFVESEGKVVQDESVAGQERNIKVDKKCMTLVQKIGNSIHSSIVLEVDYPSRHEDGKLPILDLKVWVEMRKQEQNQVCVVLHEFYSKDMASKCVINARSALQWSCKRMILTQEVLRILLNCSKELPWEGVVSHVNHMMLRLQYSGYDQKFRTEVVRSALKAYNRLIELDTSGEQPLYRPREWKRLERAQERREKRDKWYRKGGFDAVIFVPATPGSQLKDRYVKELKRAGFKIRVVEQSGVTLKQMLQRSDPFKDRQCNNITCLVCSTGGKGSCRSTSVTYELVCQVCRHTYIGETSRSAYTHGKEHLRALEQREESSVMWRHSRDKHGGDVPGFTMNVAGTFQNNAMLRQITELVRINQVQEGQFINTKDKCSYFRIPRAAVTQS